MKKIYILRDERGETPILRFLETLDVKARNKLERGFYCLATQPDYLKPPNVKHFTIERYKQLYEYRARIRILLRVIFSMDEAGDIILLRPFIKRHERDTMQALEQALHDLERTKRESLLEYILHRF